MKSQVINDKGKLVNQCDIWAIAERNVGQDFMYVPILLLSKSLEFYQDVVTKNRNRQHTLGPANPEGYIP